MFFIFSNKILSSDVNCSQSGYRRESVGNSYHISAINSKYLLEHGIDAMTIKAHRKAPVWLLTFIFAYLAILAALTVMNRLVADGWWFGAVNFYLPKIVW